MEMGGLSWGAPHLIQDMERAVSDNDGDSEYNPCGEYEECDTYSSELSGYSSEEWNDGFTDGQRNSEYADSDEDILTDDEGENRRNVDNGATYDQRCPFEDIKFRVGEQFVSPSQFRTAVKNHAIWNGFNIKFLKSGEQKMEVICNKDCPWRIYASWDSRKEHFVVNTLNDNHTCSRDLRNRQADYHWIANHFLERFRMNMNWQVVDIMREINEQFGITVSKHTCYRARYAARKTPEVP